MLAHVNTQACFVLTLTASNADMLYYAYHVHGSCP